MFFFYWWFLSSGRPKVIYIRFAPCLLMSAHLFNYLSWIIKMKIVLKTAETFLKQTCHNWKRINFAFQHDYDGVIGNTCMGRTCLKILTHVSLVHYFCKQDNLSTSNIFNLSKPTINFYIYKYCQAHILKNSHYAIPIRGFP